MEYRNLVTPDHTIGKRLLLDWLYKQKKDVPLTEITQFVRSNSMISQNASFADTR